MNNERVSHGGIIKTAQAATYERMQGTAGQLVLAVQDTTSFNFAGRKGLSGTGVLDDNRTPGFFAHTTLGVSEAGVPVGILQQQVWSRRQNLARDKSAHKRQPITAKESDKWLAGVTDLPATDKQIVTVCDREGDVYELFQYAHDQSLEFIVRSVRNRRLEDAPLLRDHLGELSAVATYRLTVQRQVNQAEREARVELRYSTVTLVPPQRHRRLM